MKQVCDNVVSLSEYLEHTSDPVRILTAAPASSPEKKSNFLLSVSKKRCRRAKCKRGINRKKENTHPFYFSIVVSLF